MTEETKMQNTKEEELKSRLVARFPFLQEKVRVTRRRRIFATVDQKDFEAVFVFAIEMLSFTVLCTITGIDDGPTLGFIYHLARKDGIVLSVQYNVPKENPLVKTVTRYFSCAEIYERELADLLGAKVEGLGEGNRYPLPDDWPKDEYPLRKDWKRKNGVQNA